MSLEQRIRERAYALWQEQGCPEGNDHEFWFRAEQEIASETAPATAKKPAARKAAPAVKAAPAAKAKPRTRKAPVPA